MTIRTLRPVRDFCRAMGDLYAAILGTEATYTGDHFSKQATQHLEWMMAYSNSIWAEIHGLRVAEPYACLRVVSGQACLRHGNTECPGCTDQAYLEHVSLYSKSGRPCVLVAEPSEYHDGLARVAEMDAAEFGLDFYCAVGGRPLVPELYRRKSSDEKAANAEARDAVVVHLAENEVPLPSLYAASFVFVNK
jgi:hypothetical protein